MKRPVVNSSVALRTKRRQAVGKARGFTLIELVVTIALAAILLSIAAPSFVKFQRNSELTTTVNSLLGAVTAARAEAMRRNVTVYVLPISQTNGWASGWFVVADGDLSLTSSSITSLTPDNIVAPDVLVTRHEPIPSTVTVPTVSGVNNFTQGGITYIRFNGQGYPAAFGGAGFVGGAVQMTNGATTTRMVMSMAGRVRTCAATAADCSATGL